MTILWIADVSDVSTSGRGWQKMSDRFISIDDITAKSRIVINWVRW